MDRDIDRIQSVAKKCGRDISIKKYSPMEFEGYKNTRFPVVSLLPLSLPNLCNGQCIFIDADTLVLGDIYELHSIEMDNALIAACYEVFFNEASAERLFKFRCSDLFRPSRNRRIKQDIVDSMLRRAVALEWVPGRAYFNSGVLKLNLDAIREKWPIGISADTKVLKRFEKYCPDQDCLNWVFRDQWKALPLNWNVQPDHDRVFSQSFGKLEILPEWYLDQVNEAIKCPKLWHFLGAEKPWQMNRRKRIKKTRAQLEWQKIAAEFSGRTGIVIPEI